MIITVGGTKGGSGKTTIATNLAVLAVASGRDVLLVDADDQETAADFSVLRGQTFEDKKPSFTCVKLTGSRVNEELKRLSSKYQDVIVDTGGRDTTSQRSALVVSDVYIVPFVPRGFDIWTIGKVDSLLSEIRTVNPDLKAYAFINRADPEGQGEENTEAAELLLESDQLTFLPDVRLGNRKAFGRAGPRGLAVTELEGKFFNEQAADEIKTLYQRCFNVEPTLKAVGGDA